MPDHQYRNSKYPVVSGETFADAIASLGFTPPASFPLGKWVRFSTNGKSRDDAGSCMLFTSGTAGFIENFRDNAAGDKFVWFANANADDWTCPIKRRDRQREIDAAEQVRLSADAKKHGQAASKAFWLLKVITPARKWHRYLERKQVSPDGLFEIDAAKLKQQLGYQPKAKGEPLTGRILVAPVVIGGELSTLEFIDETGLKSALYGGQKKAAYWCHELPDDDGAGTTIVIGEGIATVKTAAALTGWVPVAALTCGNLKAVAKALRERYSAARLVVVADIGNGQAKAEQAARAVGAHLLVPVMPSGAGGTDINDLAVFDRDDALRQLLAAAELPIAANDDSYPLDAGLGKASKPKPGLLDCAAHFPPADLTVTEADTRLKQAVIDFFDAIELTVRVKRHFDAAFAVAEAAARIQAATDASDLVEAVQIELGDTASERDIYLEIMRRAKLRPQDDTDIDAAQTRVERVFATRLTSTARITCTIAARAAHGAPAAAPSIQRLQLKAAAGLGKTSLVAAELSGREWLRTNAWIEIYVPRHELADDIADQIPESRIMRGRGYPNKKDPWCMRNETAEKVAQAGLPVFSNLCKNNCGQCPFFEGCQWVEQWKDHEPGVRIMTHHYIALPKPMNLPKPDLVIIDESCVKVCTDHHEFSPCRFTKSIMRHGVTASLEYLATATAVSAALQANGQELKKARELGLTAVSLIAAAKFIEDGEDSPTIGPRMEDAEIDRRVDIWDASEGMKLVKLYRAMAAEIDIKRDIAHGAELRRNVVRKVTKKEGGKTTSNDEKQDRVFVHLKREVAIPSDAALLLIDADASIEINRLLFGEDLLEQVLRVRRNAHVIQVSSRGFSMFSLTCGSADAERLIRQIKALIAVECTGGRKVLVVTNRSVRCKLTGEDPKHEILTTGTCHTATVAHFGNIRGNDSFKDYDAVIVVGRNQPPLYSVEQTARALWATDARPLALLTGGTENDGQKADWAQIERGYTMADGSCAGVEIDAHPDARVQSILELDRECESVQSIDRLRLIHRIEPGRVLLLCSLPVDIVVDELWDWKAMHTAGQPTLLDRLLESGACVAEPWDQMAAAANGQFPSGDAAKKAFQRLNRDKTPLESIMAFCPDLAARSFRLERPIQRAIIGTMLHRPGVDVSAWLTRHLPSAVLIPAAANAEPIAMAAHVDASNVIRIDFGSTAEMAAQVRTTAKIVDFVTYSITRPAPTPAELDEARATVALAPKLTDLSERLARLGLVPVADGIMSMEMPIDLGAVARPVVPADYERAIWRDGIAVLDGVEIGRIGHAGRFIPLAEYWRDDAMWPLSQAARRWFDWQVPLAGVVAETGTA